MLLGILAAMGEELDRVVAGMDVLEMRDGLYYGTVDDLPVAVRECGIGKINAAIAAQKMVSEMRPDAIVFSGIAGALDPKLRRGDAVIADSFIQHDFNLTQLGYKQGYVPAAGKPKPDEWLSDLLERTCGELGMRTARGRMATGDIFIDGWDLKRKLYEQHSAVCCDMESAAAAEAVYRAGVPFAIARIISDSASDGAEDYADVEADIAVLSSEVPLLFARKLGAALLEDGRPAAGC